MVQRKVLYKILGLVVGVVFTAVGVTERSSIARVKTQGETAVAQAVDTAARKSGNSKTYTARFTFKTAGGVEVTRVKSFPEALLADVQSGRPVKVLYDPRDPAKFVFENEEPSWSLPGAGIAIAIVALIFA
jgi:hypothetical protein